MGMLQVGAGNVHVDQAVCDEGGWDETRGDHQGVGLAAGGGVSVLGAVLENVGEGHLGGGRRGEGRDDGETNEEGGARRQERRKVVAAAKTAAHESHKNTIIKYTYSNNSSHVAHASPNMNN